MKIFTFLNTFKSIRIKLFSLFLLIGIVPVLILGIYEYWTARQELENDATERLITIREVRKKQIESYFDKIKNEITYLSENKILIEATKAFKEKFYETKATSSEIEHYKAEITKHYYETLIKRYTKLQHKSFDIEALIPQDSLGIAYQYHYLVSPNECTPTKAAYNEVHQLYHPELYSFITNLNYYDLLLIDDSTGYVMYSTQKEADFAVNLHAPYYQKTNLFKLYQSLKKIDSPHQTSLTDFEVYAPSMGSSASLFLGKPIYEGKKRLGILILQISVEEINNVMTGNQSWDKEGLGYSGETFLAGEDRLMRSDSRFLIENSRDFFEKINKIDPQALENIKFHRSTILLKKAATASVNAAFERGETGISIISDYRGVEVFSCFTPVNILGIRWALISKMDTEEVFAPIYRFRNNVILFILAIFFLLVWAANQTAQSLAIPITELAHAFQQVQEGNLAVQVSPKTKDELATLGTVFNTMVMTIKEKAENLEQNLREITEQKKEIEVQNEEILQQQEELLSINEEINRQRLQAVEQTKELEVQNEEIRQQQEELLAINEKLESKGQEIERQQKALLNAYDTIRQMSIIGKSITASLDFSKILSTLYEYLNKIIPVEEFGIGMYNAVKEEIVFRDYVFEGKKLPLVTVSTQNPYRLSVHCVTQNCEILIGDVETEYLRYIPHLEGYEKGDLLTSMICVPLNLGEKVIGMVSVQARQKNAYNEHHLYILRNLGTYLVTAIENAQAFEEIKNQKLMLEEQHQAINKQNFQLKHQQDELQLLHENLEATYTNLKETTARWTQSIRYAQRIQNIILPHQQDLASFFKEFFIIYSPKDTVSGDFYWFYRISEASALFVVADCTGHGVPGAFMTMVGNAFLHEVVITQKIYEPSTILEKLHQNIKSVLKQDLHKNSDGMDIVVCLFDKKEEEKTYSIRFSNAKMPMFYYYPASAAIETTPMDRFHIGGSSQRQPIFTSHQLDLPEGSIFYLASDGYIDQNDEERKSFGKPRFKELLQTICTQDLAIQQQLLIKELQAHQGTEPQRDDISVIGLKL